MYRLLLTFPFLVLTSSIFSQNFGSLTGKVIDNETGFPLEGATIVVEDSNFFAVSDQNGFFQILDLPTISYNITASFIGFKSQTKFNIIVKSVGNQSLDYTLNPLSDILDEVILTESPFKTSIETPLSTQTFSAVEIETYPGGNNDITRVIQSLPGISPSVGGFRNDIIIRGGGPNETVYYIDGIEIPNINHFSTQGSSGGPVGLVNISFIKDVTL
ncbi:MAG: TonB-dependent receptor, partial [Proteobacteria bacterium]|nr:TonB-dependent receptor [Pseudomonadota bacterium]